MRSKPFGLNTSVTTSYDKTKTTLIGRITQKTISSTLALGPATVQIADVFDDAAVAPINIGCATDNGRLFVMQTAATSAASLAMYNINYATGAFTYVGRMGIVIPTGTTTLKAMAVDDTSPTNLYIFIGTTNSTTAANGGILAVLNAGVADFSPIIGANIAAATAASQKAVYFITDNTTPTSTNLAGLCLDITNGFLYTVNGVAATYQVFKFNYKATISTVGATPVAGTTTDCFVFKTGNLPALTGNILLLNCQRYVIPTSVPANAALNGVGCIFIATASNFYLGKVSDLTSTGTTWASLTTVNQNISTADYSSGFTVTGAWYSQALDRVIYYTATGQMLIKQFTNNDTNGMVFGYGTLVKTETGGSVTPKGFGAVTVGSITGASGYLFLISSGAAATSQRVVYAIDLYSDQTFGNSYYITPVLDCSEGFIPAQLASRNMYAKRTTGNKNQYRISTTGPSDTVFNSASGSWVDAPANNDLSALGTIKAIQVKMLPDIIQEGNPNASQLAESWLLGTALNEISDYWEGSVDNTTSGGASPTRSAFRMVKTYSTSVPTLYFRAYDDNGNLVASANTSANPTLFQYTTNNGTAWNSLGTIPNTVGTTEVRYNWASPPGVRVTVSLRES